jgi:MoxR-like ATPase
VIGYPPSDAELAMLELHEQGFDPEATQKGPLLVASLAPGQARDLRALVDMVRVAPEIRSYIAAITRATRDDPSLSLGASPRATVAVMRVARAGAVLEGRDYVTPDDVKARAIAALRHRITLAPEVEVEGRTPDDVLASVLTRIPTPA